MSSSERVQESPKSKTDAALNLVDIPHEVVERLGWGAFQIPVAAIFRHSLKEVGKLLAILGRFELQKPSHQCDLLREENTKFPSMSTDVKTLTHSS